MIPEAAGLRSMLARVNSLNADGTSAITSPTTLDRLPDGTVIRGANGESWRQIDYPNKGAYWENLDNDEMYEQRGYAIPLPATVVSK